TKKAFAPTLGHLALGSVCLRSRSKARATATATASSRVETYAAQARTPQKSPNNQCISGYKFFVLQKSRINPTVAGICPRLMTDGSVPKQKPRKKTKLFNSASGQVLRQGEHTAIHATCPSIQSF
ncbi:hypothetical protein, partial [Pseudomonas lactucae]